MKSASTLKGLYYLIPARYRPLFGFFSLVIPTFAITFLVIVITKQADISVVDVLGKYILALSAIFVLVLLSFCSIISDLKNKYQAQKFDKLIGQQTTITALAKGKDKAKISKKIMRLVAIGKLNAIVDLENDTVTSCGNEMSVKQMLPEQEYIKQLKNITVLNFIGIFVLVAANLIDVFYVLDAALMSKDTVLAVLKNIGAIVIGVILIIQISFLAYYFPSHVFANSKKIQAKGRKVGIGLIIFNFIAVLVWITLIIILL